MRIRTGKRDESANNVSANSRALNNLRGAKKTRSFSDLDRKRDEGFGDLIRALSKE